VGTNVQKKLFTPVQIGPITLKHRVVMPPMSRLRAQPGTGIPSDLQLEYYTQRASDGGLIVTEATAIAASARGYYHAPGLYADDHVAAWKRITDAVHAKGAYFFTQLWHAGRTTHVSITGSLPGKKDNPAVPISPAEQVESTHEAFEAGATLVHLHVRDEEGRPTSDPKRFARVLEGIHKHCPGMITQLSTGGRSGTGRDRGGMLSLKPDMASLATGSVNFPTRVYENAPELIDWLAAEMLKHRIKPEVEAFDLSMIFQAAAMQTAGKIKGPLHVQFVMGVKNAMPVDRETFDFYVRTLKRLDPHATWTGAGIGKDQLTLNRWSLELGGHCRTGLEDNVRMSKEKLAPSNAALVKRVAELCAEYGRRPATTAEARSILGL